MVYFSLPLESYLKLAMNCEIEYSEIRNSPVLVVLKALTYTYAIIVSNPYIVLKLLELSHWGDRHQQMPRGSSLQLYVFSVMGAGN